MQYTMLVFRQADGDQFAGVFPELDSVSSYGDTVEDAQNNTFEAARLWLEDREAPVSLETSEVLALASLVPSEQFVAAGGFIF